MIMNEARSVDLRNQRLGDDKAETLHGCGHGSSVATVIEPTAFEGKSPCLTQGNPKTGQATIGVAIPIADKATRYKGGGNTRNNDGYRHCRHGEPWHWRPEKNLSPRKQARPESAPVCLRYMAAPLTMRGMHPSCISSRG